ncbi:hypothetical protein DXG01_005475, partial [Tephrocybe rancida]
MSPPPQRTLETKIEQEMCLASEYEEMEHQRDAQHIASMLSQQRPPRPRLPSLPPISIFAEPPAGVSGPAEPLFLAESPAGRTPFPTPPGGEWDLSDPVDDVSPRSSPAPVALASPTPNFGGVASVQELALVPHGLFFDVMWAVCAQDPSREWCVLEAPASKTSKRAHSPLPLSSGPRKSTRVTKSCHGDKGKARGGGSPSPAEPFTIRFRLPDRLRRHEPLPPATAPPQDLEDPLLPPSGPVPHPPSSAIYDAVFRAPLPPFGAPFLLMNSASALELWAPMLQPPSSPRSRPWMPLSGGGWSSPHDEQIAEEHLVAPASPLVDMGVSPPPDPIMDIDKGGSRSGPTDFGVDKLRELVARQAAILETFKEDRCKEQEALGHELREAQSALHQVQGLVNSCREGDLEWACLENTLWSQNEDVHTLQHRVMDEQICRDHWIFHNGASRARTLLSVGLSVLSPKDSQVREHFQDALEELNSVAIGDVQTSSWRFSRHIKALHTGHFVIPSDAELFASLFDYGDRDDLDRVMLTEEAAEYFEEHHGVSGRASWPHSPGPRECYWEEGEAGPSHW